MLYSATYEAEKGKSVESEDLTIRVISQYLVYPLFMRVLFLSALKY